MPDELWTEVHDIVQETGIKTIPMEKKCKKAKWLSEEALQIAVKRRKVKSKGEKERYTHLNADFQTILRREKKRYQNLNAEFKRIVRRDKKAFNAKKKSKTIRWERLEISSRKLETPREHLMQRWAR